MLAQKPSIAEFIVSFEQFDSIALGQAQFIGASCCEVIFLRRMATTKSANEMFKINEVEQPRERQLLRRSGVMAWGSGGQPANSRLVLESTAHLDGMRSRIAL